MLRDYTHIGNHAKIAPIFGTEVFGTDARNLGTDARTIPIFGTDANIVTY